MNATATIDTAKNKTILILEDEEVIRDTLRLALELEGYNILSAANGIEGLALLKRHQDIHLILLDLMMPIMNGWDFIQEIKKNNKYVNLPILIISAYCEKTSKLQVDGIIKKPVDLNDLFQQVILWCGNAKK